ncbi:MAG: hypothetical protein IH936_10455 [Acidobacteria bacterium]|nr:hypothetical protein [Acidobacteriota bacterium]
MNMNELTDRLERLERENRRMKRAGLAVIGLALAVALIGAATPDEIPEVIEARSFRAVGWTDDGVRTEISGHGIEIFDFEGDLRTDMDEGSFFVYDLDGKSGMGMFSSAIELNVNGKTRAEMDAKGFFYSDEKGQTRALLGVVETVAKKTGEESRFTAGVALFDDDGDVIWMAPQ